MLQCLSFLVDHEQNVADPYSIVSYLPCIRYILAHIFMEQLNWLETKSYEAWVISSNPQNANI
jgi:hypothetical protein